MERGLHGCSRDDRGGLNWGNDLVKGSGKQTEVRAGRATVTDNRKASEPMAFCLRVNLNSVHRVKKR